MLLFLYLFFPFCSHCVCLSFSLHVVAYCCLIWAFLTSLQDVFKETRSHDHVEAKNDMETHIRSRKLPVTRKIYAFYHTPIVKFWSNTVRKRRQERTHAYTHLPIHPTVHLLLVYLSRIVGNCQSNYSSFPQMLRG